MYANYASLNMTSSFPTKKNKNKKIKKKTKQTNNIG